MMIRINVEEIWMLMVKVIKMMVIWMDGDGK